MNRNIYLERYANPKTYIAAAPQADLGIIVTIPAYKEPSITETLTSLRHCDKPSCSIEVIVVLNYSELDSKAIKDKTLDQYEELKAWTQRYGTDRFEFQIILEKDIPHKVAGPGMARKTGMDEAVRRFEAISHKKGIIVGLDADCQVGKNYLTEIYNHWQRHPITNGISIYFEHPVEGGFDGMVYDGIVGYELHLRYYVNAQAFAGFPMAFQTVGSSFAVTSEAYQKQGGMNKRKAGEDFYFLHKIIPLGHYFNLNTTAVYPSPRPSDRVPFGTGRTILEYIAGKDPLFRTYNINTFKDLKVFLSFYLMFFRQPTREVERMMSSLPDSVVHFLKDRDFVSHLEKINNNCSDESSFAKGFFRWFNAFQLMKYVHFARDNYYPDQEVGTAAQSLLKLKGIDCRDGDSLGLLKRYREMDRGRR